MHHFSYKGGVLHAEGVSLARLASEVGTPFYCYSTATLERHYHVLEEAFRGQDALICYAVKANSNQAVLRTMARLGAGMDVVSEGELRRALAAGVPADKIIFAGVGKTREEMAFALKAGILGFNVESEPELEALSEVASSAGVRRASPCASTRTSTPRRTPRSPPASPRTSSASRFSGRRSSMRKRDGCPASRRPASTCTSAARSRIWRPFRDAFRLMRDLTLELRREGHEIHHLDIGGGLGVPYHGGNDVPPHPDEYAAVVKAALGDLGVKLILEPGRMIVGNAGILVARVIYLKQGADRVFTIVDAAMNDLIRPTLYEAYHEIWPVAEAKAAHARPSCRTWWVRCARPATIWRSARNLPPFEAGDLSP